MKSFITQGCGCRFDALRRVSTGARSPSVRRAESNASVIVIRGFESRHVHHFHEGTLKLGCPIGRDGLSVCQPVCKTGASGVAGSTPASTTSFSHHSFNRKCGTQIKTIVITKALLVEGDLFASWRATGSAGFTPCLDHPFSGCSSVWPEYSIWNREAVGSSPTTQTTR